MVDVEPFVGRQFELARVEPHLMQDRGVDIGHIVPIFNRVKADFVRRPMHDAATQAAARHPDREAKDVVVAAIRALGSWCAAKLAGKNN
jgi:hypothetical protein